MLSNPRRSTIFIADRRERGHDTERRRSRGKSAGQAGSPSRSGWISRVWRGIVAHPIALLVLVAALGTAGIVVTYTTDTSVTTQTTDPPVQHKAGGDAGPNNKGDYVTSYSISTNNTNIDTTVKRVPEGNLTIDSFFRIENKDDQSQKVTLDTSQISNANLNDYSILIEDSSNNVQGHLDLQAGSPSTTFTMANSDTYDGKLYLELASGTTDSDLSGGLSSSITLTVE